MNNLLKKWCPPNWEKRKISELLFFQEGPGVRRTQFKKEGVKLLNVGNINNNELDLNSTSLYVSEEEAYGKYKHFLVDEGDLLIACSGIAVDNFTNKIAFASKRDLPLCMNTSTMRFKVIDINTIDIRFFYHFLKTDLFKEQLRKLITGSAQLNFGPSHITRIQIPLPSLPEQKRIAEILDKADALRQKNKQLLAAYDELLQATFLDMFGDPVTNPKGLEKINLNKIARLERGRFSPRPRNDPSYFNGPYPFIQTGDISKSGNRLDSYTQTLNDKGIKVSKRFEKGTIVIAIVGATIGATAILELDVYATDSIIGISVNKKLANNIFLEFVMQFWKPILLKIAPEAARANINLEILGKLDVIVPPITLQNQFAQIVENIEAQKTLVKQSMLQSEDLFNGLVQKAFGGEL